MWNGTDIITSIENNNAFGRLFAYMFGYATLIAEPLLGICRTYA